LYYCIDKMSASPSDIRKRKNDEMEEREDESGIDDIDYSDGISNLERRCHLEKSQPQSETKSESLPLSAYSTTNRWRTIVADCNELEVAVQSWCHNSHDNEVKIGRLEDIAPHVFDFGLHSKCHNTCAMCKAVVELKASRNSLIESKNQYEQAKMEHSDAAKKYSEAEKEYSEYSSQYSAPNGTGSMNEKDRKILQLMLDRITLMLDRVTFMLDRVADKAELLQKGAELIFNRLGEAKSLLGALRAAGN
jgi:hypothetical protein